MVYPGKNLGSQLRHRRDDYAGGCYTLWDYAYTIESVMDSKVLWVFPEQPRSFLYRQENPVPKLPPWSSMCWCVGPAGLV